MAFDKQVCPCRFMISVVLSFLDSRSIAMVVELVRLKQSKDFVIQGCPTYGSGISNWLKSSFCCTYCNSLS